MSAENPRLEDLPEDEHLRNDVVSAAEDGQEASPGSHFTPGLTNAGQQVGGLASATGYGDKQEPDDMDSNKPV
jgi:hypothetical protein